MLGLRAARANFLPGLVVQCFMLGLLLAYEFHPATTERLNALAAVKQQMGYGYSCISAIIAGAILPELLRIACFQNASFRRSNLINLITTIPFWGVMGMTVDVWYRFQGIIFGTDAEPITVIQKVVCDQLFYTSIFATPMTCLFYDWKNLGCRWKSLKPLLRPAYYPKVVVPTLIVNYCVWIPLLAIIYALPMQLQIPLFSLALTLWVMLCTWISERRPHILQPARGSD